MTGTPNWKTCCSVAVCGLAAFVNVALIILGGGAPDTTAMVLLLAWSCVPFGCLVLLAVVARKDTLASWALLLICIALAVYDGTSYSSTFYLMNYDAERRRMMPGATFGGHVLGFGLFIAWPATLLAAIAVLICRRRGPRLEQLPAHG